jgi:hypothetical protein
MTEGTACHCELEALPLTTTAIVRDGECLGKRAWEWVFSISSLANGMSTAITNTLARRPDFHFPDEETY